MKNNLITLDWAQSIKGELLGCWVLLNGALKERKGALFQLRRIWTICLIWPWVFFLL